MAKCLLFTILMILVFGFPAATHCQTNNQLQSARVYSGFSLGMYAGLQEYTYVDYQRWDNDALFTYNVCKSKMMSGFPYYFRSGIRNRVELRYTGFILIPYIVFVDLGVNVKCFEYGKMSMFKNITLTLSGNLGGGSGGNEKWGGLIISTTHRFRTIEIEMVLEPFYSNYDEHYDDDEHGREKRMESFNLSSGVVTRLNFNPENRFYFEIRTGLNWQYVYDSHYLLYRDDYNRSTMKTDRKIMIHSDDFFNGNNFGGNVSIAFNWLRKKRT
jgi:hypothetical protein